MNHVMATLTDGKRLVLSVALLALVHVGLLRYGSEDATPGALLTSFAIAVSLLLVAQRLRLRMNTAATPATTRKP